VYLLLKALAGGDGDEHVQAFAEQILGLLHHIERVALILVIIDDTPVRLTRLNLDVHDACLLRVMVDGIVVLRGDAE
jgi:hypothetical protein